MNFKKSSILSIIISAVISASLLSTPVAYGVESALFQTSASAADLATQKAAIVKAVEDGKIKEVESLLENNESLKDVIGGGKNSLLHISIENGHDDICLLLLDLGVEVNSVNLRKKTPLHVIATKGYTNILEHLLKKEVEINAKDGDGNTALYIAVEKQNVTLVSLLLNDERLNPLIKNSLNKTVWELVNKQAEGALRDKLKIKAIEIKEILVLFANIAVRRILETPLPTATPPSIEETIQKIISENRSFFLSYCWSADYSTVPMVDDFEKFLQFLKIENYFRDKRTDPNYGMVEGTDLKKFMEKADSAHAVIIFLNPAYLMSLNCMFEFSQVWDGDKVTPNVYIIRHPQFTDIFSPALGHTQYTKHWEEQYEKVRKDAEKLLIVNKGTHTTVAKRYQELQNSMENVINFIANQITGQYEDIRGCHFQKALERALRESKKKA